MARHSVDEWRKLIREQYRADRTNASWFPDAVYAANAPRLNDDREIDRALARARRGTSVSNPLDSAVITVRNRELNMVRAPKPYPKGTNEMGYHSHVKGTIVVKPALKDPVLVKNGFHAGSPPDNNDLFGETDDNETVAVVNGELTVVGDSFTTFRLRYEDDYKAYNLEEHVRLLAALCTKEGVKANGVLTVYGEDDLDVWRLRMEDNQVTVERPKLVWPNGDEEECNR